MLASAQKVPRRNWQVRMDSGILLYWVISDSLCCSLHPASLQKKKLFANSRKQYQRCWVFSKEVSSLHFHWSSTYVVMTCLACRLTSLSGKHGNLPCHQQCGTEIREQTNQPGSQLQRRLPGLWVPSQPVLGLSGWHKECSSTNLGTTCLICQSPANLGDDSPGSHLVFHKKFWQNYMFASFSSTET